MDQNLLERKKFLDVFLGQDQKRAVKKNLKSEHWIKELFCEHQYLGDFVKEDAKTDEFKVKQDLTNKIFCLV